MFDPPLEDTSPMPAETGVEASPEDEAFEEIVVQALADLPPQFGERLENVAIRVVEEPNSDDLAAQRRPGILLGLFTGWPRTAQNADFAPASQISIFRGPLTRLFRDPDALREAVREVVFHEVGHYFGITDERLDELEREKWASIHAREGRR